MRTFHGECYYGTSISSEAKQEIETMQYTTEGERSSGPENLLPLDHVGEVLRDEALVVGLDLLNVHRLVALAVEVVGVERANGLESALVLGIREVRVRALAVPGVEAVVADHIERVDRQRALLLEDVVHVLIDTSMSLRR